MTHCSDDDLVLHYYGELPEADEHLASCTACREQAQEVAALLASVTDDVPERGEQYGLEVWHRVRPHLQDQQGLSNRGGNVLKSLLAGLSSLAPRSVGVMRPAFAALAVVVLVGAAFFAGRVSMQPAPAVILTTPTTATSQASVDPGLGRRVLLLSVADHLERSDRVLTDIMNAPGGVDLSAEQQWADDLVAANRIYRQDALDADESSVASVLDELERALLDIVHRPADTHAADLDRIRNRIDSAALLFKVRVLTNELRQRQLGSDAPSDRPTIPIS